MPEPSSAFGAFSTRDKETAKCHPWVRHTKPATVYGFSMVGIQERESIDDALRLATDLCLALGAFAVGLTGSAHLYVSEAVPPDDVPKRMERLARSCLVHPAAHGRELFWNAEVPAESGSADRSLACAVMPVWKGSQVGLLGIVDTWLPEPDDDQRAGLTALAAQLARTMPLVSAHADVVAGPGSGDVGAPAPPGSFSGATRSGLEPGAAPAPAPGGWPEGKAEEDPRAAEAWPVGGAGAAPGAPGAGAPRPPAAAPGWTPVAAAPSNGSMISWGSPWPTGERPTGQRTTGGVFGPSEVPNGASNLRAGQPWTEHPPVPTVATADLVGALDDAVVCLDGSGTVVLANRAADVLYGLGPGNSLVGLPLPDPHAFRDEDDQPLAREQDPGLLVLRDGVARNVQLLVGGKESQRRFAVAARVFTVGGGGGALVVMHDTTAEWMEQQRLSRFAMYDPLTGLANRYLLLEEMRRMLQGLGRRGGSVSLVYLDLDKFKLINDEHGHDMGDEVLGAVARRLRGAVRGDDIVARLGGDEFVLAHASADSRPDGDLVVSRLRKVLSAPFRVRGHAFDVGASIGWVSTDRGDVGPEALLARADRAMYQSKRERAARRPPT